MRIKQFAAIFLSLALLFVVVPTEAANTPIVSNTASATFSLNVGESITVSASASSVALGYYTAAGGKVSSDSSLGPDSQGNIPGGPVTITATWNLASTRNTVAFYNWVSAPVNLSLNNIQQNNPSMSAGAYGPCTNPASSLYNGGGTNAPVPSSLTGNNFCDIAVLTGVGAGGAGSSSKSYLYQWTNTGVLAPQTYGFTANWLSVAY